MGGNPPAPQGSPPSAEALARILGYAGLQLAAQGGVVEALADQHQLVLAGARPVAVVEGEALAR